MNVLKKTILIFICAFLPSCMMAQSVFDLLGKKMIGYRVNRRSGKSIGAKASFIVPSGNWANYYGSGFGVALLWGGSDIEDDIHQAWSVGFSRVGANPNTEYLGTTVRTFNGQPTLFQTVEHRDQHLTFSVGNIFDIRLVDRPVSPIIGVDIHAHYHMFNVDKVYADPQEENLGWQWYQQFGVTITPRFGINIQGKGSAKFRINAGYTFAFFPNSSLGGGHHLTISFSAYFCYDKNKNKKKK